MFETMCILYPALYTVYNAAPTPLVSDALSTTQSQTVDSTLLALATTKKGISNHNNYCMLMIIQPLQKSKKTLKNLRKCFPS